MLMSKFIPVLFILFIIFPVFVFAQQQSGSPPSFLSLPNPLAVESFEGLITAIINWLLIITLPIIVLLLLYAGFQLMISGVSPEGRKNSLNIIKYAIIGYAIMLMAKVLVGVIIGLFSGSSPSTTSAPAQNIPTTVAPPSAPAIVPVTEPLIVAPFANKVRDINFQLFSLRVNDRTEIFIRSGDSVNFSWSVPSFYNSCTTSSNPPVVKWNNISNTAGWPYGESFTGNTKPDTFTVSGRLGDVYKFILTCVDEVDGGQDSLSVFVNIIEDE